MYKAIILSIKFLIQKLRLLSASQIFSFHGTFTQYLGTYFVVSITAPQLATSIHHFNCLIPLHLLSVALYCTTISGNQVYIWQYSATTHRVTIDVQFDERDVGRQHSRLKTNQHYDMLPSLRRFPHLVVSWEPTREIWKLCKANIHILWFICSIWFNLILF